MLLTTTIIVYGSLTKVREIKESFENYKTIDKKFSKHIKKLISINSYPFDNYEAYRIKFTCKKLNIDAFMNYLKSVYDVSLTYMVESQKNNVWIVSEFNDINTYQLIPEYAISDILLEYMEYRDASIILDNYETIKYDHNINHVVIDNRKPSYEELIDVLYKKTLNGKYMVNILEDFIIKYYERCINTLEELYSSNKENLEDNEEPSPLALFIVTFGVLGIIAILVLVMGLY